MGTVIRPELSEKNEYRLEKHRYYELKHFCLQYPIWKKEFVFLDGFSKNVSGQERLSRTNEHGDPTSWCAASRVFLLEKIEMVENAALDTDKELSSYILKGVTEGASYVYLKARLDIPCSKDTYYKLYRRFFWLLDKERQ